MLLRTHLAISIFAILVLLNFVQNKILFVILVLISTVLPDIDSEHSFAGRKFGSWIFRFFTKHRGIFHSFTFLISVTIVLALFLPTISLGFFTGYSLHLFADAFTFEGIRPFWPSRIKSSWRVSTGEFSEKSVFILFLILDVVLLILRIGNLF